MFSFSQYRFFPIKNPTTTQDTLGGFNIWQPYYGYQTNIFSYVLNFEFLIEKFAIFLLVLVFLKTI
jgi:hypothetical protein